VVSLEQAVAAPMCTCRLADAGARVIKIERPEGDFARYYDGFAHGECSYFVWLNRGKESVVLDLVKDEDKALLRAMLKRADIFVQNLKPGTVEKLGFPISRLRRDYPNLICCSISGFGEAGRSPSAKPTICSFRPRPGSRRSPARRSRRASACRSSMSRPD
jgi:itaconate CoA-transferase